VQTVEDPTMNNGDLLDEGQEIVMQLVSDGSSDTSDELPLICGITALEANMNMMIVCVYLCNYDARFNN
jgi:hypothetical protein